MNYISMQEQLQSALLQIGVIFLQIPCNVCNEGFDQEGEAKKHIEVNHKDILIKISQNIEKSESEDSKAFLARFEDAGNLFGERINWSHGTVLLPPV